MTELIIVGGGLAGSEAAWQAAQQGISVKLYEMRPLHSTGAHVSSDLAELVCSNSLGSNLTDRASGLLKQELRQLNSLLLECAEVTALPAGSALAVDRVEFARAVTHKISQHPEIELIREEITVVPPSPAIIASGPLTSESLTRSIQELTGHQDLFFFDAIAPVVIAESVNMDIAFLASRFSRGQQDDGDYINCPFTRQQYDDFVTALKDAERIALKEFEQDINQGVKAGAGQFFEGCLPVEILAQRGHQALAFGPMRPVGLIDTHTGKRPYAVIQLRQDNLIASLYNMVGFQTNLTFTEQKRIFRMIPGLENAEFARFGQMHRNTFINSPLFLNPTLQFRQRPQLFFAGQITGVEGYMGNIGTGLLAGINAVRLLNGKEPLELPATTILGALCHYITHANPDTFQPVKANFGILPPLAEPVRGKRERANLLVQRSLQDLENFIRSEPIPFNV